MVLNISVIVSSEHRSVVQISSIQVLNGPTMDWSGLVTAPSSAPKFKQSLDSSEAMPRKAEAHWSLTSRLGLALGELFQHSHEEYMNCERTLEH